MRAPSPEVARRRRLVAGVIAGSAVAAIALALGRGGDGQASDRPARLALMDNGRRLATIPLEPATSDGRLDRVRLAPRVQRALAERDVIRQGRATLTVRYDLAATVGGAMRLGPRGGRLQVTRSFVSSRIDAPVLQQAQKNTCESAALEILLATRGVRADQNALQDELPRSGPLDPTGTGDARVWGDPELGYVGRTDGGGTAGGFGVFQRPVASVAARRGVRLEDLTRQSPSAVYDRLRRGRAVMVWVGLSEGPYGTWRSPEGRRVRVNFGEHTVVLTGMRADGRLSVSNPLEGTAETWTRATFEAMWERLDRRALAA